LVQNGINQLNVADQTYNELIALAQKGLEVASRAADANADTSATTAQLAKIATAITSILTNADFDGVAALGTDPSVTLGGAAFDVTPASPATGTLTSATAFNTFIALAIDNRAENGANLAALQNMLQVLNSSATNMLAGMGQAQDTDIAKEMMTLTSANIMTEAATAMLAQAMQLPNSVLKLLQ
jgi:flagellin